MMIVSKIIVTFVLSPVRRDNGNFLMTFDWTIERCCCCMQHEVFTRKVFLFVLLVFSSLR